jgi:hypothetical protein
VDGAGRGNSGTGCGPGPAIWRTGLSRRIGVSCRARFCFLGAGLPSGRGSPFWSQLLSNFNKNRAENRMLHPEGPGNAVRGLEPASRRARRADGPTGRGAGGAGLPAAGTPVWPETSHITRNFAYQRSLPSGPSSCRAPQELRPGGRALPAPQSVPDDRPSLRSRANGSIWPCAQSAW